MSLTDLQLSISSCLNVEAILIEKNDNLARTYIEFCQVLRTKELFSNDNFFKVILQGSEIGA